MANQVSFKTRVKDIAINFASSDGACTLGFIATPGARPKTLLAGDELDHTKSGNLKIVLSKACCYLSIVSCTFSCGSA
ncbi:MAG: hypothetical protein K6E84_09580 [Lachnospiraceae bacterium]|nr:hypothetical protein [Lachnospiraceae bacterium]